MPPKIATTEMTRLHPIDRLVGSRARMRRMMLGFSQEKTANALGITFQQLQKYEKGVNRISASRLHQLASVLEVSISFFFEGAPQDSNAEGNAAFSTYVSDFLTTSDGLALTKAFTKIEDAKLRQRIVRLVEEIAVSKDASH